MHRRLIHTCSIQCSLAKSHNVRYPFNFFRTYHHKTCDLPARNTIAGSITTSQPQPPPLLQPPSLRKAFRRTLDEAVPASAKSDQVKRVTTSTPFTFADSVTDGLRKNGWDSKCNSVNAVSSLSGDSTPDFDTKKKIRLAEQFGITIQLFEEEKCNSRTKRFGTGTILHGSESLKKLEELKRKVRAERFGLPVATDEEAKKKARLERF